MEQLNYALRYLNYLLKAKDEHSLHSPFLFDLYTNVIQSEARYYSYEIVEAIRAEMLESNQQIEVTDYGAGSRVFKSNRRQIKSIAKTALKAEKYGQLIFRLIHHFKIENSLELGTSLGITTSYMASVNSNYKVTTFEGCPRTSEIAKSNFDKLGLNNITQIEGNFDDTLPKKLDETNCIDFVYIDGNHRKEPTLNYFNWLLEKSHDRTILIFDDIHWSDEMDEAWQVIKSNDRVSVTIDLFHLGIVFFRKEQVKQDFVLKY